MNELLRLLLLVALAGTAVTFLGSVALWLFDEERRIRRALTRVLKAPPEATVVARGRGRGAGFSFASDLAAVAWDNGGWCLIYRLHELVGAELLVDGVVIARVARGEPRRALDRVEPQAAQVTLRLIFDDPKHPDFPLDLYLTGDEQRRQAVTPAAAIQEANRWLARAEAILRRPPAPRGPTPVARAEEPQVPAPAPAPPPPPPAASPTVAMAEEPPPWDDAPIPAGIVPKRKRRTADDDQDDLPF